MSRMTKNQKGLTGLLLIFSLSPDIPYALLAFYPQFMMNDLPPTSKRHARECLAEAKAHGLKNVRLGNVHLLGDDY